MFEGLIPPSDFAATIETVTTRARHRTAGNFERCVTDVSKYVFAGAAGAVDVDLPSATLAQCKRILSHNAATQKSKRKSFPAKAQRRKGRPPETEGQYFAPLHLCGENFTSVLRR